MSDLQDKLAAAKLRYFEAVVRRDVVQKPGWQDAFKAGVGGDEPFKALAALELTTVCEVRGYVGGCAEGGLCSAATPPELTKPSSDEWNNLWQGVCRFELARLRPALEESLFAGPFDRDEYWHRLTHWSREHLRLLWDTADFHANYLLRILYLYGDTPGHLRAPWREERGRARHPRFSAAVEQDIQQKLVEFKYWLDEPFHAEEDPEQRSRDELRFKSLWRMRKAEAVARMLRDEKKAPDKEDDDYKYEMTYWSENHQILFATAEYLAGQLWPEVLFRPGLTYREDKRVRDGELLGKRHMEKAKRRLVRWLDDRLRFGFSEWNSSGYYKEDFDALINLVDFCLDEEIRGRAIMVVDLLLFDLARFTHRGSFGPTGGRVYADQKQCGWEQSVGGLIEMLFGSRGVFVGGDSPETGLATSSYEVPDVLMAIGRDRPVRSIDRTRVSLDFSEAGHHGIGFESDDDVLRWWSRSAYVNKEIVDSTQRLVDRWKLRHTDPFGKVLGAVETTATLLTIGKLAAYAVGGWAAAVSAGWLAPALVAVLGNPFDQDDEVADFMSVMIEGSTLSRANLYTYRNRDVMLSSVQNYRPGQVNFQGQFCQATLSLGATVWTTYPSAGIAIIMPTPGGDGPNWWTGSVVAPRVLQTNNAAIIMYKPKALQVMLTGGRTHAWFPRAAFDRVVERPAMGCEIDRASWVFGQLGDGYVGLFSAQPMSRTTDGSWKDRELIADGDRNVFVLQVGNRDEYGSFDEFVNRVSWARIHINGLKWILSDFQCSYDAPRPGGRPYASDRMELHYDDEQDQARYRGQAFDDSNFPRFESPYIKGGRVPWGQYQYTIEHAGQSLSHDFRDLEGDGDGRRPRLHRTLDVRERAPGVLELLQCGPQVKLSGVGSSDAPALATAGPPTFSGPSSHRFCMAWKGVEDDQGLYWSWLDGERWEPPMKIGGVGSSAGPALASYDAGDGQSGLCLAWKGVDGDQGLYVARNPYADPDGWRPQERVPGAGTSHRPAVAWFAGRLHLVWKGVDGDQGLYWSQHDGVRWSGQQKIAGVGSSDSPTLAAAGDHLELSWKGVDDDARIYGARLGRGAAAFGPQAVVEYRNVGGRSLSAVGTSHGPRAVSLRGELLMVWKGVDDDAGLWLTTRDADTWRPQLKLEGVGTSASPALAVIDDRLLLVWKGVDDDAGLYASRMWLLTGASDPRSGSYFRWPS